MTTLYTLGQLSALYEDDPDLFLIEDTDADGADRFWVEDRSIEIDELLDNPLGLLTGIPARKYADVVKHQQAVKAIYLFEVVLV